VKKNLKKKFYSKKFSLGSWINFANTASAEIMAKAGFDWLAIDMEHSAITLSEAQELIRVIDLAGCIPLVRVGDNDPALIKRVMDAGAYGIIVPMVNSVSDAIKAVSAVKYPPMGTRGVGLARAQGYGLEFKKYKNWINENSIVIAQVEHVEAINNLEGILKVEGIDASIIGPYDLSASLGYPGDFKRKEVKSAIAQYVKVCKRLKKSAGFHVVHPDAEDVKAKRKEGFNLIAFGVDMLFLGDKIRQELKGIKR